MSVAAPAAAGDDVLHELRAARRAAVRAASLAKAPDGAPFGLLVLPVDFADSRFAEGYDPEDDLAPRLADTVPGALGHYVAIASRYRCNLEVVLAPVISLDGERGEYSDIGWQGSWRSRAMAREALEGAAALGVDFASADGDGDGEVDGVLLLHAAPGLENDSDGLIVPLQYFLAEPVIQRGTTARMFAMASAHSTLGIWAHETGHLLGLEDRYDLGLPGNGETGPRGGLGRFSLMSAGWLGSGDGADPSLPDGYSRLQLGWADLGDELLPGTVLRPIVAAPVATEYFLAEQRFPDATAPYDAAVPADRLLVYHIDTTLADGQASSPSWPDRHLRVHLVEADGGDDVARGESDGSVADLFPTEGASQAFDANSLPSSRAWDGSDTGVALQATVSGAELVVVDLGELPPTGDLRLPLVADNTFQPVLQLRCETPLPAAVSLELTVENPQWGTFVPGSSQVTCELTPASAGLWHDLAGPTLAWLPGEPPPSGAATRFIFEAHDAASGFHAYGDLLHVWDDAWSDLDLDGAWPGEWDVSHPGGDDTTTWLRWPDGGNALPPGPLLVCTGAVFTDASAWPDNVYSNDAHTHLLSPPLGADVQWLELQHSPHLELLHVGSAVDGVSLAWVHVNGTTAPATPADGWLGSVDPRARHALSGLETFAVADSLDVDTRPLWRREILAVPDPQLHGPGPWRLQLEMASSPLYRDRGWLVRALAAHLDAVPDSGLPLWLDGDALHWGWTGTEADGCYAVQRSDDGGATWHDVATGAWEAGEQPITSLSRDRLGLEPAVRSRLRVAIGCEDRVVSRAIVAADPAVPALSLPRPNPCTPETGALVLVDGAGDDHADLALFDLRGRRVRRWQPGGAATGIVWDGAGDEGRRLPAGVYIFRLRAQGRTLTCKVTWLH